MSDRDKCAVTLAALGGRGQAGWCLPYSCSALETVTWRASFELVLRAARLLSCRIQTTARMCAGPGAY